MPIQTETPISSFTVARMDIYVFRAAVSVPVVTSFARMDSRATAILRVEDSDGAYGWGEIWGNFPSITTEYRAQLAGWLLPSLVIGKTIDDPAAFFEEINTALKVVEVQSDERGPVGGVIAGLDQALWDLAARRAAVPLRQLLRADAPDRVPAYASGLNPGNGVDQAAAARENGFRRYKLKIGFGKDIDHTNIRRIKDAMGAGEMLYTDANMRWSLEEAIEEAEKLAEFDLGWLEEPIRADLPAETWRALKAKLPMPLAGGENLRGDAAFTGALEWLDFVQPDVGKLGGVSGCLGIGREALVAGRTYCPHWLSGGVGLLHSANLLAAAGGEGVLEMDINENPLRDAVVASQLSLVDGDACLPTGPGIGIDVDTAGMAAWQVSHESFS